MIFITADLPMNLQARLYLCISCGGDVTNSVETNLEVGQRFHWNVHRINDFGLPRMTGPSTILDSMADFYWIKSILKLRCYSIYKLRNKTSEKLILKVLKVSYQKVFGTCWIIRYLFNLFSLLTSSSINLAMIRIHLWVNIARIETFTTSRKFSDLSIVCKVNLILLFQ